MDRGAWQTIVYGFTWSDTTERLTYIHTHTHTHTRTHTILYRQREEQEKLLYPLYCYLAAIQEQTVFTK